jgi:hypothetical protein
MRNFLCSIFTVPYTAYTALFWTCCEAKENQKYIKRQVNSKTLLHKPTTGYVYVPICFTHTYTPTPNILYMLANLQQLIHTQRQILIIQGSYCDTRPSSWSLPSIGEHTLCRGGYTLFLRAWSVIPPVMGQLIITGETDPSADPATWGGSVCLLTLKVITSCRLSKEVHDLKL